jgi:hypothetical protein
MKAIRTYHWAITGGLFAIALALYIAGFGAGAALTVFIGFIVESAAWISLAFHPRQCPSNDAKE